MLEGEGSLGVAQLVLAALGLTGGSGGVLALWTHRQSRRAEVAANEREARAQRTANLEELTTTLRGQLLALRDEHEAELLAERRDRDADAREFRRAIRVRDDYINRSRRMLVEAGTIPEPWPDDWTHY